MHKFEAIEINYEIHDKELLAIIDSFEQWKHLLEGSPHQIIVYNDHKNFTNFQNARILSDTKFVEYNFQHVSTFSSYINHEYNKERQTRRAHIQA